MSIMSRSPVPVERSPKVRKYNTFDYTDIIEYHSFNVLNRL